MMNQEELMQITVTSQKEIHHIFKCCKSKVSTTYYVCIKCYSIMHSSCFSRTKSKRIIEGHKIICTDCQLDEDDDDQIIPNPNLNELLQELKAENDQKTEFIKKLQAQINNYGDEASEMEERLNKIVVEQEEEIKTLKNQINIIKVDKKRRYASEDASTQTVEIAPVIKSNHPTVIDDNSGNESSTSSKINKRIGNKISKPITNNKQQIIKPSKQKTKTEVQGETDKKGKKTKRKKTKKME